MSEHLVLALSLASSDSVFLSACQVQDKSKYIDILVSELMAPQDENGQTYIIPCLLSAISRLQFPLGHF